MIETVRKLFGFRTAPLKENAVDAGSGAKKKPRRETRTGLFRKAGTDQADSALHPAVKKFSRFFVVEFGNHGVK
jgi:hypothetical protein